MAMTDKYDLETYSYSVTDKSGIATANAEKLDDHIHTRLSGTFGEAIDEYEAVYLKSDGKFWLAQANGTAQPCIGLAVDSGIADDAGRIQRVGPITNSGWAWSTIGASVFLDPTTPGALTDSEPGTNAQFLGIVISATSIVINPISISDIVTLGSGGDLVDYALLDGGGQIVQDTELKDYCETASAPSSSSGAVTLDIEDGNVFELELTEAITSFTISNPPASAKAGSFTLILKQDTTGGWAVTWPASILWAGGTAPTLTTSASAVDLLCFITTDAGTTWYGMLAGADF